MPCLAREDGADPDVLQGSELGSIFNAIARRPEGARGARLILRETLMFGESLELKTVGSHIQRSK